MGTIYAKREERKAVGAANANQFAANAQEVWAEKNIDRKRALVMRLIDDFKYKEKQPEFRRKAACADAKGLDVLASSIMLYGENLSVIR